MTKPPPYVFNTPDAYWGDPVYTQIGHRLSWLQFVAIQFTLRSITGCPDYEYVKVRVGDQKVMQTSVKDLLQTLNLWTNKFLNYKPWSILKSYIYYISCFNKS
jgi:hypothetical protein